MMMMMMIFMMMIKSNDESNIYGLFGKGVVLRIDNYYLTGLNHP